MNGDDQAAIAEEPVRLDPGALDELKARLTARRRSPDLGQDWGRGMPRAWLDELLEDWSAFDTGAFQQRLDALVHMRADVAGQAVHLVRAEGRGPRPLPLLLTHGWPGSFLEYLQVLPLLTDPGAHGADPADSFTVIVPSLPGYGFSAPPPSPEFSAREVAGLWHALMSGGFGHDRYVAHGSDLGAPVTSWLARDHPEATAAIHLATPGMAPAPTPHGAPEKEFAAQARDWASREGGYMHEHATKPATLGAALSDSPAGLAAWIGEKYVSWSSTRADGSPAYARELLLSTLTLYWATNTIATSLLPYWASRESPDAALPVDDPSPVPTAISVFAGERIPLPKPPRELAERYWNVTSWAEHPVGGHFPAIAEPELLARTLRDAFRPAR